MSVALGATAVEPSHVDLGLDFSTIDPIEVVTWRKSLSRVCPPRASNAVDYPTQESLSARLGISTQIIAGWETEGVEGAWAALLREHWAHDDPIDAVNTSVAVLGRVFALIGGVEAFVDQVPVSRVSIWRWQAEGIVPGRYGWGRLVRNLAVDFGVCDCE